MARKLQKVPSQPGTFRVAFSKHEVEMLEISIRRQIHRFKYRPNSPRKRHYQDLLQRVIHARHKINEQLEFYRKSNNLERCEYLEYEDRLKKQLRMNKTSSYVFTKS